MKVEATHTIRSAFGKILSMNRTEDKSMIVSVEINFFSPRPILYTNTKQIDIVFCVSGEIYFNTKYGEECMNSLEKYSEEEIKHKSNKIAEKYFTGLIIDEIASDIFEKTSIISAYPVRI